MSLNPEQLSAASPDCSSWISASAGSGKTKVLINRLVLLLLKGEAFASLLCFTYTNAAAAEMRERLQKALKTLAEADEADREAHLMALLQRPPTALEKARAESLNAEFSQQGQALRIQTIHSFCKDFLATFAFEAETSGSLTLLESEESAHLLKEIQERCLLEENNPSFLEAFQTLSQFLTFDQIDETLLALLAKRYNLAQFLEATDQISSKTPPHESLSHFLIQKLALNDPAEPFDASATQAFAQRLIEEAPSLTQTDRQALTLLERGKFGEVFLTRAQTLRKKILSAALQKSQPDACAALVTQAERFDCALKRQKIRDQIAKTQAFVTVARTIFQRYQECKRLAGQADFEDLILQANSLLQRAKTEPTFRQACRHFFPLRHLFLDEAQDTSPQQWQIALQLAQTLFSADKGPCTVFVVGDIKQSIYSFQGSRPELFHTLIPLFRRLIEDQGGTFQTIALQTSYRTAPAILETVDTIFQNDPRGVALGEAYRPHRSARTFQGFVESLRAEPKHNSETDQTETAQEALARTTVTAIASLLEREIFLPCTGQLLTPDDVLILSRRRGAVLNLIADGLEAQGIAVAGLDKQVVSDHLIWQDLVALVRFFVEPHDDYNLACLLKSPLFGCVTDEALWTLGHERPGSLLETLTRKTTPEEPKAQTILRTQLSPLLATYSSEAAKAVTKDLFYAFLHCITAHARPLYTQQDANLIFEVFLEATQQFLTSNAPSWLAFLRFLENKTFTKSTKGDSGVRFMTVHGSKGLQAPVVILVDEGEPLSLAREKWFWFEADSRSGREAAIFSEPEGLLLMPPQHMTTPILETVRTKALNALIEEDRRLLYVALTRAQDGLIVIGSQKEGSWSALVQEALVPSAPPS